MCLIFWISILAEIIILPLYFLSLEHKKLQQKYGHEKGTKIGDLLGLISGWGFFIFLFGIWLSPQPRFTIPLLEGYSFLVPIFKFKIPLVHLIIFIPTIILVLWLAFSGLRGVTIKVAETHRAERVVTTGIYAIVRHPQYLGSLFAHIAISILLSALYSLLLTPFLVIYIYLISWKEEKELINEFGKDYDDYKAEVPMFIPKIKL